MSLSYQIAAPLVVAAAAAAGVVAHTPPVHVPGGEYTQYGVIGALVVVIMGLLSHTIPKILDNHTRNAERIADEMKSGMGDVRESIDKGNDKVSTLLQSTLTQILSDRREGK